jgi:hypothetical protein
MKIGTALSLLAVAATLSACSNKPASIVGAWKVAGMDLKPDSLVQPGMIDKEGLKKMRFNFNADSTVVISDGTQTPGKIKYTIEKTGSETFLVLRPEQAPSADMQGGMPTEQRMRIIKQTADKLDLEQKFDPYTFTTHLEAVR